MNSASKEKLGTFNCFSVHGTGGSPTGPDPENSVGDQDTRSTGKPVFVGWKFPVSRGITIITKLDNIHRLDLAIFLTSQPEAVFAKASEITSVCDSSCT